MDWRFNEYFAQTLPGRRRNGRRIAISARIESLDPRIMMDAAPSVGAGAAPLTYVEKQGAVAIDPSLTITAGQGTLLEAATVRVLGYQRCEDALGVTVPPGLASWWDANDGVLTLTGLAPASTYQSALRSVTYADVSANPNPAPRVAEFVADSGQAVSPAADRSIRVVATNDPPSLFTPPAQTIARGATLRFATASFNRIYVGDVDANGAAEQVTLSASHGRLSLAATSGMNFTVGTGTADGTMTFSGTLDRINCALDGLTFTADPGFAGSAALLVSIDDLGNTGLGGPQVVNALVPIAVAGSLSSTPSVGGSQADEGVPASPPPAPDPTPAPPLNPISSGIPSVPEPTAPGRATMSATLAVPPSAASPGPDDAPAPPNAGNGSDANAGSPEQTGGAIAAASASGGTDVDSQSQSQSQSQRSHAVFYMPPPARPTGQTMRAVRDQSANSAWASTLVLASAPLNPLVQSVGRATDFQQAVGCFAIVPIRSAAGSSSRPRASFKLLTADNDREDFATARNAGFRGELDALRRRVASDTPMRIWAGTASVISIGASMAWFLWSSRAGSLLSGLLPSMPAWRLVDPLPVIDHLSQTTAALKRNADDGIEKLLTDVGGSAR